MSDIALPVAPAFAFAAGTTQQVSTDPRYATIISVLKSMNEKVISGTFAMGGALRDTDHGKDFRDIDLFASFANDPELKNSAAPEALISRRIFQSFSVLPEISGNGGQYGQRYFTAKFKIGEKPVEYTLLEWPFAPTAAAAQAGVGLMQIAMDADGNLIKTGAYEFDKRYKTFTVRNITTDAEFEERLVKIDGLIRHHYTDYGVSMPETMVERYAKISEILRHNRNKISLSFDNACYQETYTQIGYSVRFLGHHFKHQGLSSNDGKPLAQENIRIFYPKGEPRSDKGVGPTYRIKDGDMSGAWEQVDWKKDPEYVQWQREREAERKERWWSMLIPRWKV